jgi:hypothetical protein
MDWSRCRCASEGVACGSSGRATVAAPTRLAAAALGRGARRARLWAVLGAFTAALLALCAPLANAATQHTQRVALIPANRPVPAKGLNGIMPTSGTVTGRPSESFDKFSFSNLAPSAITPAALSHYDTVALIDVRTSSLNASAQAALAQFVARGGKLIIHDADDTKGNDYSWLLGGAYTTQVGASCNACGSTAGTSSIVENSALISTNAAMPSYINLGELGSFTDAIGDSNLLVSTDPRWFVAATGTDGAGGTGAQVAYAKNNGLVLYNGYDTDMIKASASGPWRLLACRPYNPLTFVCPPTAPHPSVDWLAQMWYSEVDMSWQGSSSSLPQQQPALNVGTPLSPGQAGLPANRACVPKRTLVLHLRKLLRLRHGRRPVRFTRVDVYLNGRRVVSQRAARLHDTKLTRLPRRGKYSVIVVVTTGRLYHLVSRQTFHAC